MKTFLRSIFCPRFHRSAKGASDLDQTLLHLSRHAEDAWTVKDSFSGALITGETGSGKSTGSGAALARAFLKNGYGGLVLTCKPDEVALWKSYCAETDRLDSLVVFGSDQPWRCNFLDYERSRPGRGSGQTENIISLFADSIELIERREGQGRSDPYWDRCLKQLLRNATDLLSLSRDELRMVELYDLITSAPQNPEQLQSESWRESSFCMRCIRDGEKRQKTESQRRDFEISARFWLSEFPTLSDCQRRSESGGKLAV